MLLADESGLGKAKEMSHMDGLRGIRGTPKWKHLIGGSFFRCGDQND